MLSYIITVVFIMIIKTLMIIIEFIMNIFLYVSFL